MMNSEWMMMISEDLNDDYFVKVVFVIFMKNLYFNILVYY